MGPQHSELDGLHVLAIPALGVVPSLAKCLLAPFAAVAIVHVPRVVEPWASFASGGQGLALGGHTYANGCA